MWLWIQGFKAIFLSNNRDDEGMEDMKKETLWRVGSTLGARREEGGCKYKNNRKIGDESTVAEPRPFVF